MIDSEPIEHLDQEQISPSSPHSLNISSYVYLLASKLKIQKRKGTSKLIDIADDIAVEHGLLYQLSDSRHFPMYPSKGQTDTDGI